MEQFRITAWPDSPLPPPQVERAREVRVDADGWLHLRGGWTWAPLPDELVLRELLGVRCDSADDVVAFTAAHGIITKPAVEMLPGPQLDIGLRPSGRGLHVVEMASYLRWTQGMTLHLVAALDGERVMSAWERTGIANERRLGGEAEEDTAWAWFTGTLNAGLGGLQPYVRSWTKLPSSGEQFEYGEPRVGLFTGMAAQVFNLAVEGLPVRTCANETCQRRFVRQVGRARKGQSHTSGVLFCSGSCAKAQAQREYRRRQRKVR